MGVFWDWASLSQKDPALWHPCCGGSTFVPPEERRPEERAAAKAYERSHTEVEKEGFNFALSNTMDLWYAHQGTTVFVLTQLPEGSERAVGYVESGWTTYERCSAEQNKKAWLNQAQWKLVLDLGVDEAKAQAAARNWPTGPNDFDVLIEAKKFTNGADKGSVKMLYRKISINQLGSIKEFDFGEAGMRPPSVEDGRRLGGCLSLCSNLENLDLQDVGMSDEACEATWMNLDMEALAKLGKLRLCQNQI
eukprot:6148005-Prymnesium_polylepis.1